MLVRYWQPWREMETLRRQLDQAFDDLNHTVNPATWAPAIEFSAAEDRFVLRVQLPGIDAKDLDIQVTRDTVAVAGEYQNSQKADEAGVLRSEFRYGKFRRVVNLPAAVKNDQVQADYKDGILTLTLPKVDEVRNRVVKVSLTGATEPAAETSEPAAEPTAEASHA